MQTLASSKEIKGKSANLFTKISLRFEPSMVHVGGPLFSIASSIRGLKRKTLVGTIRPLTSWAPSSRTAIRKAEILSEPSRDTAFRS